MATHHQGHAHQHGPGCGHTAIQHNGHTDYLHDGHLHHMGQGGVEILARDERVGHIPKSAERRLVILSRDLFPIRNRLPLLSL